MIATRCQEAHQADADNFATAKQTTDDDAASILSTAVSGVGSSCASDFSPQTSSCGDEPDMHVVTVEGHLADMNGAAEQVNLSQQALRELEKERRILLRIWSATSEDLEGKIGADRVLRACRRADADRSCEEALEAVEEASRRYMEAVEESAAPDLVTELRTVHAAHLAVYKMSQHHLAQVYNDTPMSKAAELAVAPFLEAGTRHRDSIRAVDAEIARVKLVLNASRRRYADALRALENLSEEVHRKRGVGCL
mmetsp:Transcript_29121/g.67005  ORF Transcript_29121/g.67005 Transcript_29121/m.67005 type:complete len:253 (-) Transcript_29121:34-792(-)